MFLLSVFAIISFFCAFFFIAKNSTLSSPLFLVFGLSLILSFMAYKLFPNDYFGVKQPSLVQGLIGSDKFPPKAPRVLTELNEDEKSLLLNQRPKSQSYLAGNDLHLKDDQLQFRYGPSYYSIAKAITLLLPQKARNYTPSFFYILAVLVFFFFINAVAQSHRLASLSAVLFGANLAQLWFSNQFYSEVVGQIWLFLSLWSLALLKKHSHSMLSIFFTTSFLLALFTTRIEGMLLLFFIGPLYKSKTQEQNIRTYCLSLVSFAFSILIYRHFSKSYFLDNSYLFWIFSVSHITNALFLFNSSKLIRILREIFLHKATHVFLPLFVLLTFLPKTSEQYYFHKTLLSYFGYLILVWPIACSTALFFAWERIKKFQSTIIVFNILGLVSFIMPEIFSGQPYAARRFLLFFFPYLALCFALALKMSLSYLETFFQRGRSLVRLTFLSLSLYHLLPFGLATELFKNREHFNNNFSEVMESISSFLPPYGIIVTTKSHLDEPLANFFLLNKRANLIALEYPGQIKKHLTNIENTLKKLSHSYSEIYFLSAEDSHIPIHPGVFDFKKIRDFKISRMVFESEYPDASFYLEQKELTIGLYKINFNAPECQQSDIYADKNLLNKAHGFSSLMEEDSESFRLSEEISNINLNFCSQNSPGLTLTMELSCHPMSKNAECEIVPIFNHETLSPISLIGTKFQQIELKINKELFSKTGSNLLTLKGPRPFLVKPLRGKTPIPYSFALKSIILN